MKRNGIRHIELLAPARDAQVAVEAVKHGADAVYMGAPMLGARAAAANTVDDMARVCDCAHVFGARVYATVNTLIYDHELQAAERMVWQLWRAGVDALIVQDMGLLRLDLPPIALHASTQCDIRTPEKARFLQAAGFSQLVLARELTLDEIAGIRQAVDVPLEAFVHGALCVCYSGRCRLSQAAKGRSANRGECAQMCRLPYDLVDDRGRVVVRQKHLLSLRDLNRDRWLQAMIGAGVTSFKIEGRLKDVGYVKNVVAHYRQAFDRIIGQSGGELRRSSFGASAHTFVPDVHRSFNRSFTGYFLTERRPVGEAARMASLDTPKSVGQLVGKAISARGTELLADLRFRLANGDGLSFMGADGRFVGARVNVAAGRRLTLRERVAVQRGAALYRTYDKEMDDALSRPSAVRRIALDARLRLAGERLVLTLADERGCSVTHAMGGVDLSAARMPQREQQTRILAKLGDTPFVLREAEVLDGTFVPASALAQLRRETLELLERAWRVARVRPLRRPEDRTAPYLSTTLTPLDNVANRLAGQFYRDHGVTRVEPALECRQEPLPAGIEVMHTRYCVRRELGACLRSADAKKLPARLFLRADNVLLALHCDCRRCEMRLLLQ